MSDPQASKAAPPPALGALMVFAWAWVGTPFAYGVYQLIKKVTQLFQ